MFVATSNVTVADTLGTTLIHSPTRAITLTIYNYHIQPHIPQKPYHHFNVSIVLVLLSSLNKSHFHATITQVAPEHTGTTYSPPLLSYNLRDIMKFNLQKTNNLSTQAAVEVRGAK